MNSAVTYLSKCNIFYLATVENDEPRVRPFGAIAELDGKPYLCTNNLKNVYRQLQTNPHIQICGMNEDGSLIRVTAKAVPDHRMESKLAFLEACPGVKQMYQATDPEFEVLCLEDAVTEHGAFNKNGYVFTRV
jgi:uncharacterized pyridoxamine 5'-phosphate oxidase family protein